MKRYYPYLTKGELNWEQQKRFFHCLRGTIDLIVNKKIFIHDSSRDYFTKEEVFKLFHLYFKYNKETAVRFTNQLLAIKRILIGGSVNHLKDKELSAFYNLIYDYKDAYFMIHKQLPVFMRAWTEKPYTITSEQRSTALEQTKKAFQLLKTAYERENITYPIQDIYRYGSYFKQAGFLEDEKKANRTFYFFHHLVEGTVFPEKEIKNNHWADFFSGFYNTLDLFLYYKASFLENLSDLQYTYARLESARLFLSLLSVNKKGFPLNNLDEMLYVLISFFDERTENSPSKNILSQLKNKQLIRFFTRALTCFSLKSAPSANCFSEWGKDSAVVTFSFPDSQFQIFSDKRLMKNQARSSKMFLDTKSIDLLNEWIHGYKTSLFELYQGEVDTVAVRHQFDHWLKPFFGWGADERIQFGIFYPSNDKEKTYQLLNYQAFLSLLFSSYLPHSYFVKDEKGIPFKVWIQMVSQLSPILTALGGSEGYKTSWKKSFSNLFFIADSFLNSSNRDQHLNSREFIDLAVHLLEAVKSSQKAFNIVSSFCRANLNPSCIATAIIEDRDILSAYPRFQGYIFDFKKQAYKEKIQKTLEAESNSFSSFQLIPLFFLLQSMELNYHIIDQNQSFNLESEELLLFAKEFQGSINQQIPYILNSEQALSYLMYSFKTGNMPFFTGSAFEPVRYTHWHLSSKNHQAFTIAPNDFHFLIFDFYNLYKQF